ncbi:hypothetical protein C6501_00700 [Candidatus Poribacteria bacterium]|nr:MAG: hypothetical protein C6501_00700 [Candidatus Poribacteria bacterium]
MVYTLTIHPEMTFNEIATAIADTIPHEKIITAAESVLADKSEPFNPLNRSGPWRAALNRTAEEHIRKNEFLPIKTIVNIMVNHYIDYHKDLCPRASVGALYYFVDDCEISKSYPMLIREVSDVLFDRYYTPESVDAIRGQAA